MKPMSDAGSSVSQGSRRTRAGSRRETTALRLHRDRLTRQLGERTECPRVGTVSADESGQVPPPVENAPAPEAGSQRSPSPSPSGRSPAARNSPSVPPGPSGAAPIFRCGRTAPSMLYDALAIHAGLSRPVAEISSEPKELVDIGARLLCCASTGARMRSEE
jgi:hypothetical protein